MERVQAVLRIIMLFQQTLYSTKAVAAADSTLSLSLYF